MKKRQPKSHTVAKRGAKKKPTKKRATVTTTTKSTRLVIVNSNPKKKRKKKRSKSAPKKSNPAKRTRKRRKNPANPAKRTRKAARRRRNPSSSRSSSRGSKFGTLGQVGLAAAAGLASVAIDYGVDKLPVSPAAQLATSAGAHVAAAVAGHFIDPSMRAGFVATAVKSGADRGRHLYAVKQAEAAAKKPAATSSGGKGFGRMNPAATRRALNAAPIDMIAQQLVTSKPVNG